MFEQSFVQPVSRTRTGWSLVSSFAFQAAVVSAALIVPLFNPQLLPAPIAHLGLLAPPRGRPEPPPQAAPQTAARPRPVIPANSNPFYTPARIPTRVATIIDPDDVQLPPGPDDGVIGGIGGGPRQSSSFVDNLIAQLRPPPPERKPPQPAKPSLPAQIAVSKGVQEAMLIHRVTPAYPPLAVQTRTEGVVQLRAIIDREGKVTQLQVLSGNVLLLEAALSAVRQWRYRPTLLSGVPVEVVTQIDVRFTLTR